ncbi:Gamma-tubulin complex component 4 [Vitis vinifera]|uniref:Gamma-tubulin complex component 4 n=1 Tax=Vitis vinifera TaxID=29760 RepID=A0A438KIB1_VITVI|nr:Gamma-tubulin complex component 4 [Vitis vinifera]
MCTLFPFISSLLSLSLSQNLFLIILLSPYFSGFILTSSRNSTRNQTRLYYTAQQQACWESRAPFLRRFLLRLNFNSYFEATARGVLNVVRSRPSSLPV